MLGDDDARTLRELEHGLAADDGDFVRRFEAVVLNAPALAGPVLLTRVVGALVLGGLMVLAGSAAGAIAFCGLATLVVAAWWYGVGPGARRRRLGRSASTIHPPDVTPS